MTDGPGSHPSHGSRRPSDHVYAIGCFSRKAMVDGRLRAVSAKDMAKRMAARAGVLDQIRLARQLRTANGRRNYRDDRNLRVLLAAVLGSDSNAVDIGANEGEMSAEILRCAPRGNHVAIEPLPHLAAGLRARFPTIEVHEVALSDHDGTAVFHVAEDAPALSGLQRRPIAGSNVSEITVTVAMLDSILPEDYTPDFIKIDVEGGHVPALRGARRILASRPVIWLDHGEDAAALYDTSTRDVWDLLVGEFDYRLYTADGDGPLDWPAFAATDHNPLRWTFLARP